MRLVLFCVAALLVVQVSSAQITVQQSTMQAMFSAGNPLSIDLGTSPTDTTLNIGLQGANRVYDFSMVSFELYKVDTIKQVSDIPYLASRFPGEAVTLTFEEGEDSFENSMIIFENDAAYNIGNYEQITPDSIVVTHDDPYELFLKFPITYSDSVKSTSTITDSLYVMGVPDSVQSHVIPIYYVVDGWGTLKLPGNEEYPCLRLRWYEEIPDENPETPDYHYLSFRYVTENGVFIIIDSQNDQPFEGEVALDGGIILFRSSAVTSVSDKFIPEQFTLSQNYPNPFNPLTNFEFRIGKTNRTRHLRTRDRQAR
ncbi:MAG: hypothetical protein L0Y80_11490 [Ignavibacteriae bacterium]|nr:hypothetical protein [Ignavibacteriota bacterium]